MAQFDVYRNDNADTNDIYPYLLDVQSNALSSLPTRTVIPLARGSYFQKVVTILNLKVKIDQVEVVVSTAQLASVDARILGAKVATLRDARDEIVAAIDLLISAC